MTRWVPVGTTERLGSGRMQVVDVEGTPVVVGVDHQGFWALEDTCIHRERSLAGGVVLNGRLVCPGHQWAFRLRDGWCRERSRSQPVRAVRLEGDVVMVSAEPVLVEHPDDLKEDSTR